MQDHTQCLEKLVIVLPSLDPDAKFDGVVEGLVQAGFAHILIVDDGSDAAHQIHFEKAAAHPVCRVLHHGVNKGKGRALKTAFRCVLDEWPEAAGVITIDGDGQHLLEDIIACGERMLALGDKVVLGCRDFDAPGVPPRSVVGKKNTSRMFRLFYGARDPAPLPQGFLRARGRALRVRDEHAALDAPPRRRLRRAAHRHGLRPGGLQLALSRRQGLLAHL